MLTYYPAVAASGNLAEALTRSFGRMGSSLSAYSPEPSAPPPSTDSPQPPHMPEADWARVRVGDRLCQVAIGLFIFPVGSFCLTFFDKENENNDVLTSPLGMMLTEDLATAAHIIRRFLEDRAGLKRLAKEFGIRFAPDPYSRPAPDSVQRMQRDALVDLARFDPHQAESMIPLILDKIAKSDPQKAETLRRHILEKLAKSDPQRAERLIPPLLGKLAKSDPQKAERLLRHILQGLAKSDPQKAQDLHQRLKDWGDRDRREE